jgi:hypothetical protein
MCRVYGSGEKRYVRLCYYHGHRRGERVPVDPSFELTTPHYPRSGSRRRPGQARRTLCFLVSHYTGDAVVEEMARYANADWEREENRVTLRARGKWRDDMIIRRAETFGWRLCR